MVTDSGANPRGAGDCRKWDSIDLKLLDMPSKRALKDACARIVIDPAGLKAFVDKASSAHGRCTYRRLDADRPNNSHRPEVIRSLLSQLDKARTVGPYNARVLSVHDLEGPAAHVMSMFRQIGIERRGRTGHLLQQVQGEAWMLLYCDIVDVAVSRDPEGMEDNHWVHGPHLHLIHSLERSYRTLDQLEANFMAMRPLKSPIHVRFHDPDWGQQFQDKYHPSHRS